MLIAYIVKILNNDFCLEIKDAVIKLLRLNKNERDNYKAKYSEKLKKKMKI